MQIYLYYVKYIYRQKENLKIHLEIQYQTSIEKKSSLVLINYTNALTTLILLCMQEIFNFIKARACIHRYITSKP